MSPTYATWIFLGSIGIIAGIYFLISDKGRTSKIKREFYSSLFFTFVMLTMSIVSFFEIGFSFFTAISFFFFLSGIIMIIRIRRKINKEKNSHSY